MSSRYRHPEFPSWHKAPQRSDRDTDVKLVPRASYRRESKLSTYLWTPENMKRIPSAIFEKSTIMFGGEISCIPRCICKGICYQKEACQVRQLTSTAWCSQLVSVSHGCLGHHTWPWIRGANGRYFSTVHGSFYKVFPLHFRVNALKMSSIALPKYWSFAPGSRCCFPS